MKVDVTAHLHGYDSIDDQIVWDVIGEDLDELLQDAQSLIKITPGEE